MISNQWEVTEDGYNRNLRLVQYPSGFVLGYVSGQNYVSTAEWDVSVFNKSTSLCKLIGRYVTEGLAKKALEEAVKAKKPTCLR